MPSVENTDLATTIPPGFVFSHREMAVVVRRRNECIGFVGSPNEKSTAEGGELPPLLS